VPTLLINARNDPFLPEHALQAAARKAAPALVLEFLAAAATPDSSAGRSRAARWLPQRLFGFFAQ